MTAHPTQLKSIFIKTKATLHKANAKILMILLLACVAIGAQSADQTTPIASPTSRIQPSPEQQPLGNAFPEFSNRESQLSALNIVSLIIGLIGVVGSVYTYLSWRAGKKREKVYEYLFEVAEKSIDAKATEEKLARGREEVTAVSRRIEELQEKIRKGIPKEAKRAVLTDRFNSQVIHLKELYESLKRTKAELSSIGDEADLPPEIRREIEAEIKPEYLLRDKRSNLKTYLTLITAGAAISSAVLPFPFGNTISFVLLLFAVPIIALLVRYSLPVERDRRRQQILQATSLLLLLGSLASLLFGVFLVRMVENDRYSLTRQSRQLIPLLFVFSFLLAVGGIVMLVVRKVRSSQKKSNNR